MSVATCSTAAAGSTSNALIPNNKLKTGHCQVLIAPMLGDIHVMQLFSRQGVFLF